MEHLLQFGLSNAAAAGVLAVLAAIATRVWRNPHFAYALWFVVLLRLVAPPLLPIALPVPAWLAANSPESLPAVSESQKVLKPSVEIVEPIPRSIGLRRAPFGSDFGKLSRAEPQGRRQSSRGSARGSALAPDRTRLTTFPTAPLLGRESELVDRTPLPEDRGDLAQDVSPALSQTVPPSSAFRWPSIPTIVAAMWLSGTLCHLLLIALRVRRFARMLRQARREVPAEVAAQAAEVATAVGLRRVPRLAFANAALPPMVWPGWRPVVLLPESLFTSLGAAERRLLLWHEFLHLRRRDHLVRWFEVFIVGLYWWNPVAWWAVTRLQRAEEDCCDAAVLFAHPHESACYGETLVSVAQFLSVGTLRAPSLSVGVARNGHIKRRLAMILHGPRWPELSKTRLAGFSLLGAALVAVTWTAAKAQTAPATAASGTSPSASADTAEARLTKPQQREDLQIDEILVEGNVRIPSATILQTMNIQAGRKVPQSQIEAGCDAVMKTRQFFSALPVFRRTGNKTTLTLRVLEKPLVRNVSYLGARMETQFDTERLAAVTGLKVGDPYFIADNRKAARHLEKFYHEHGYPEATVELLQGDKPEDRDVVFAIDEGSNPKAIWRYFVGNESVSGERLARELKSLPANAGKFDRMNFSEDVAALRKLYAGLGFRNANVTPLVLHSNDRKWIYVQYTVSEGLPYQPAHGSNVDTKAADKAPASSRLVPTEPLPEKRDVRLSQIAEMQPAPGDDELRKLQKERFNAALRELKLYEYQYEAGTTRMGEVCKATRNLFDAWAALAQSPADRLHAADWYVGYTNRLWNEANARLMVGGVTGFSPVDEAEARAGHFEAEIESMKLRQRSASKVGEGTREAILRDLQQGAAATKSSTTLANERPFLASDKNAVPAANPPIFIMPSRATAAGEKSRPLPQMLTAEPVAIGAGDDQRVKLLKELNNAALASLESLNRRRQTDPMVSVADLITKSRQLLAAQLGLAKPEDVVGVYERYLELMKYFESPTLPSQPGAEAPAPVEDQAESIREARLAAEVKLLEARQAALNERQNKPAGATGASTAEQPGAASAAKGRPSAHEGSPFPSPALLTQKPLAPEARDDERHKLLKERYNAALRMLQATYARHEIQPTTTVTVVVAAARRMLAADLALAGDGVAVRERYLEFTKYLEREAEALNAAHQIGTDELEAAREARLDAEFELLESKTGKAAPAQSHSSKADPGKSGPFSFYVGPTR